MRYKDGNYRQMTVKFNLNNPRQKQAYEFLAGIEVKEDREQIIDFALWQVGQNVGWKVPAGGIYQIIGANMSAPAPNDRLQGDSAEGVATENDQTRKESFNDDSEAEAAQDILRSLENF